MCVYYLLVKREKLFGQSDTLKEEETKEKCFFTLYSHLLSFYFYESNESILEANNIR